MKTPPIKSRFDEIPKIAVYAGMRFQAITRHTCVKDMCDQFIEGEIKTKDDLMNEIVLRLLSYINVIQGDLDEFMEDSEDVNAPTSSDN